MKPISDRTWRGQQSWNREVIESMHGLKPPAAPSARVRYRVKIDSYDFQSYATAELWSGTEWKEVHRIPGQEIRSSKLASAHARNVRPDVFDGDLDKLRAVVKAVLSS